MPKRDGKPIAHMGTQPPEVFIYVRCAAAGLCLLDRDYFQISSTLRGVLEGNILFSGYLSMYIAVGHTIGSLG